MDEKRHLRRDGILTIDDADKVSMQVQGSDDSQDIVDLSLVEILENFIGGLVVLEIDGTRYNGRLECKDDAILSIVEESGKRLLVARLLEELVDKHVFLDARAGIVSSIAIYQS